MLNSAMLYKAASYYGIALNVHGYYLDRNKLNDDENSYQNDSISSF